LLTFQQTRNVSYCFHLKLYSKTAVKPISDITRLLSFVGRDTGVMCAVWEVLSRLRAWPGRQFSEDSWRWTYCTHVGRIAGITYTYVRRTFVKRIAVMGRTLTRAQRRGHALNNNKNIFVKVCKILGVFKL